MTMSEEDLLLRVLEENGNLGRGLYDYYSDRDMDEYDRGLKEKEKYHNYYCSSSKEDLIARLESMDQKVRRLEDLNIQHREKISEYEAIVDNLSYKLKESETELKKTKITFRNQTFEGLRESIYELYNGNTDEARATIIKCENFMNFGNPQTLDEIPNKYHLQEAIIRLRYRYVVNNVPTTVRHHDA
jgi:hypothetical protein